MIVMPHASTPSPMLAFVVPPAAVSAVAYAPHCRAGDRESPDVFGRPRREIQVRKWRVAGAPSGALEQLGDGREGALPGHVRGAGVVLVAQARAGAGAQQPLHQRRIAVAAGDDESGATELVLRVLIRVPGGQLLADLHGPGVPRRPH